MVRLGHVARVHESLLRFTLDDSIARSDGKSLFLSHCSNISSLFCATYFFSINFYCHVCSTAGELVRDMRGELAALLSKSGSVRGDEWRSLKGEIRTLRRDLRARQRQARRRTLATADIVLSTCVSSASRSLSDAIDSAEWRRSDATAQPFDVAVIDEAAQSTEAACWLAVLQAKRVVLAGDHLQLPPTILSDQAANGGLAVTLVDRVVKLFGKSCTRLLDTQYRMHEVFCFVFFFLSFVCFVCFLFCIFCRPVDCALKKMFR